MKHAFAIGVLFLAGGAVIAAPVPAETRKPAAFPAGHYVLAGSGEAARGDDVHELTKPFRLRVGQYVLSGGLKPTDLILVDDDLEVHQDGKPLFIDDDHVRSTETRGKMAARYKGYPIVLVLDPAKKVRITAIDCFPTEAILGELWLHRWDGARKKLTAGKTLDSPPNLPATFFDESFDLTDGFEFPEKVTTDATIELPAKPASLLPRFQPPTRPIPQGVSNPRVPDARDFVFQSVLKGLTEDGVPLVLISDLAKSHELFLGKCPLCQPTLQAFEDYAKLKVAPAPIEGKGLSTELANRLESKDKEVRGAALREMIAGYAGRGYARITLTAEQRTTLEKELLKMHGTPKNTGGGLKFCPSCDGVCRLLPKP